MAGKRPDFNLLVPIEKEGKDGTKTTQWVRFGSVWMNGKGNMSGNVDFWPVGAGNRVVMMPPKSQDGENDHYEAEEVSF